MAKKAGHQPTIATRETAQTQAAISAADAVCVGERGLRSISQTHMDQVRLTRQLFPRDEQAKRASNHLAALLDRKNTVEYEGRLSRAHDAASATKHAERLVAWARSLTVKS